MRNPSASNVVHLALKDLYFTSGDLDILETVLTEAMTELERTDTFGVDDEFRRRTRLRLAAAIMRRASLGERNPATLVRVALEAAP